MIWKYHLMLYSFLDDEMLPSRYKCILCPYQSNCYCRSKRKFTEFHWLAALTNCILGLVLGKAGKSSKIPLLMYVARFAYFMWSHGQRGPWEIVTATQSEVHSCQHQHPLGTYDKCSPHPLNQKHWRWESGICVGIL